MNANDSYEIIFTNEMLKSIGLDTDSDEISVKIIVENGNIKISKETNVF